MSLNLNNNNIQIKEKNEYKIVFITCEGLFKLTAIFFSLTNSSIMFQTIMNEILQNLINIEEVMSFMDNVLIETERERLNEIVEEIVRNLVENNLYMKR